MDPEIEAETVVTDRDRWLAARRMAITATDAGAILGVSSFATPLDVFLSKTGQDVEVVQTERMEAGNRMQRPIIDWWSERRGEAVVHEAPWTFRTSAKELRIGASLDAYRVEDAAPVDAKNVGWQTAEWGAADTDKIPLKYAVQLAVQMYVTEAPRAFLPVLFGGNELVSYRMERDRDLEASIIEKCLDFWNRYVATDTTPPVDGSEAWGEYLKRKFAKNTEVIVRATADLEPMVAAYRVAIEQAEAATMEVDRLKNQFKELIGENAGIEGPKWKATWKLTADQQGTDFEAVAKYLALKVAIATGAPATKVMAEAAAANQRTLKHGSRRFLFTARS